MTVRRVDVGEKPLSSIGIGGSWGYIGRRFLHAARQLGLQIFVHDPSPPPEDLDLEGVTVVTDSDEFYGLPLDIYHLALHPQHRWPALKRLARRAARGEEVVVLCEKPVVVPENPQECHDVLELTRTPRLKLFYDFPELFDPQTALVHRFLGQFESVRFRKIWLERGKDREDPSIPRNYKIMVPIQYQETVHCLAFMLDLLARYHGESALELNGISLRATSRPYSPPNPECYPGVVDGKCSARIEVGHTAVHIETDFKKGAAYQKRRRIEGEGDGTPFVVEAELLEGCKYLRINGEDQHVAPDGCSYMAVLRQLWEWNTAFSQIQLNHGLFPNARLACAAYLLSASLWEASFSRRERSVHSIEQAFQIAEAFRSRQPAARLVAR